MATICILSIVRISYHNALSAGSYAMGLGMIWAAFGITSNLNCGFVGKTAPALPLWVKLVLRTEKGRIPRTELAKFIS